jgi:hypothetical protein
MVRIAWMSLILLLTSGAARGETVRVDDLIFELPLAAGLCAVDRNHPNGRKFYEQQERAHAGRNRVLSLAIDCRDVESFERGGPWRRWASWAIATPNGKPNRIPSGYTRGMVFAELWKRTPALDRAKIDSILREAAQRDGAERNVELYGTIDRDRYGIYMGNITDRVRTNRQMRMVAVLSMAPIRGSVVSFNLARVDQENFRIDELLAETKLVMKTAYERNGGGIFQ